MNLSSLNSAIIENTCFTPACVDAAASMLQSIDMNIDPCSDFYKFTCGNWITNTVIPEELAGFGVLEVEYKKNKEKLRAVLDGDYTDLLKATKSKSSFQVENQKNIEIDKLNFKTIKNYYSSCININDDGEAALLDFFTDIHELNSETQLFDNSFQLTKKIMDLISYPRYIDGIVIEAGGLFSFEIIPDEDDESTMAIVLAPPKEFEDSATAPMEDLGLDRIFMLTSSLLGLNNRTERDRERCNSLAKSGTKPILDSDIYNIVEDALNAQKRLFYLSKTLDKSYYTYTVQTAANLFPFIGLKSVLKSNIPNDRDYLKLSVEVYNLNYFSELNRYASIKDPSRTLNKDSLSKYLLVHKIVQDASTLDFELRNLMPDSPFQTRSSLCVEKVLENFGLASGRFYSMLAFRGEADRTKINEIARNIKASLSDRIKTANWLDAVTKMSAIRKLYGMKEAVGYSISKPDLRSPLDTQAYLLGLDTDTGSFYTREKKVAKWTLKTYWNTLGREVSRTEWIGVISPQIANAFNLLSRNSIVVSAAFAQKPNYDLDYPDYFNYGGIGQTLGHEYSHGFDESGSQYDQTGMERDWWSDKTKIEYQKKAQCFIDQYSNATVMNDDGRKYKIDGLLTLSENIADNEGLLAAYDAYILSKEKYEGYNPILPGLSQYSPEALFFINAGRSFCSKSLPGTILDSLNNEHAPDSVRANLIFQNNQHFAEIFNCPVGSKMNPNSKKCRIW